MENKKKENLDYIFQEVDETTNVYNNVNQNVDELFKVVGTNLENAERLNAVPYSYWRMTFKELFTTSL